MNEEVRPDIDWDALLERIRDNAAQRAGARTEPAALGGEPQILDDARDINQLYDLTGAPFSSHRPRLGHLLTRFRKKLADLLAPLFIRQSAYNAAATRLINHLFQRDDGLAGGISELGREQRALVDHVQATKASFEPQLASLRRGLAAAWAQHGELELLGTRLAELTVAVNALRAEAGGWPRVRREMCDGLDQLRADLRAEAEQRAALQHTIAAQARELRLLREQLGRAEARLCTLASANIGQPIPAAPQPCPETPLQGFDSARFEERVQGRERARRHERRYLDLFRGRSAVLDAGCGRGAFLELLRDAGIGARGVDRDPDLALLCREKGLAVVQADLCDYLQALPADALDGLFSAQVLEHLGLATVARMVALAHRKLRPGAIMVLETLHPESLLVHFRWFPLDPTHVQLVHPETLKFLLQAAGFSQVREMTLPVQDPMHIPPLTIPGFPQETFEPFNQATDQLSRLLFASEEYALVGVR